MHVQDVDEDKEDKKTRRAESIVTNLDSSSNLSHIQLPKDLF